MMASEKQREYERKYKAKLYRIPVYIPHGQKEALEAHAKGREHNSLNAYIKTLIEADSGLCMDAKRGGE